MSNTAIPQNYFVGSFETSSISQDIVSQNGFPINAILKWRRWVSGSSSPMSNNTCGNDPVSEDDLKKSDSKVCWDKDYFFLFFSFFRISSQQAGSHIIPCLVVATLCLFKPMSSNTLMPPPVSTNPSVNIKSIIVLSLWSGSGSITT